MRDSPPESEWSEVKLATIIKTLASGASVNGEGRPALGDEIGVLKVSAVSNGRFFPDENKVVYGSDLASVKMPVAKGDLLISRANTFELIGACGHVQDDYPNLYLPDKLWKVVLRNPSEDCTEWLLHVLNSPTVRQALRNRATGTSGSMKNIPQASFLAITVLRSPPAEQKKIAAILSTWDRAIELTEKLIAANQKRKAALMQQLLTGKVRLPGYGGKWVPTRIGQFLRESRLPGSAGDAARKITVKLYGRGVVKKDETRLGSVQTKYYKRLAGQFIYSKLDFLNGAFGVIPQELAGYESTLDLPAFDIGEIDARWFLFFVTRAAFYKTGISLANGGRKARRVNPNDFLKTDIPLPPRSEQSAIADVIILAVREIELQRNKLDALRRQKKGLMQQLLTGKVRVRVEPDGNGPVKGDPGGVS